MSSELSGSHGDRPEPGGDRPREHRPWDDPGRDVTPVPASAGWKPEGKFSRADYYDDDGTPKDRDPGAARDAHRADAGDQGDAPQPDGPADDPADAGSEARDVEDETVPGSEDSGLRVREIPEETAEAAAAGGSDPPRRPPGGDSPHDDRPPGPGYDRVPPPDPRDQGPGKEETDRKPAPARPEQRETPRGDAAAGHDTGTRAGDDDAQERQPGDQPAERDQGGDGDRGDESAPDRVRAVRDEQQPDDAPDQAADQNWDAIDQRIQAAVDRRIEAALEGLREQARAEAKADYETTVEEQQAEIESLKFENQELRQKAEGSEAKAEDDQPDEQGSLDRPADGEADPDGVSAEQRGDRLRKRSSEPEFRPDDSAEGAQDQGAVLGGYEGTEQRAETKKTELPQWRRLMTSDNITAAGTVSGAVNTVAMFAMHATPDGAVSAGLTVFGLAALVVGKIEKHRKDKHGRAD